jgi:1,2-dihydroxy-3-keto-5-methylthiopentene dioxygenase
MAVVVDKTSGFRVSQPDEVRTYLAGIGIDFERWTPEGTVEPDAPAESLLDAYGADIERIKARGGYVTADVIAVSPATPGLEEMLAKFASEHTHDDDEVRFVVSGRGIFFIHSADGRVTSIEVEAGDLIRLPSGIKHWFTLCDDRSIRAIRLFKDPAGWVPRYTESGTDRGFQPICLGPSYVDAEGGATV